MSSDNIPGEIIEATERGHDIIKVLLDFLSVQSFSDG